MTYQALLHPNAKINVYRALTVSTSAESGKSRTFASYESTPAAPATLEITYEYYTISGQILTTDSSPLPGVTLSAGLDIESDRPASRFVEMESRDAGWTATGGKQAPHVGSRVPDAEVSPNPHLQTSASPGR